MAETTAAVTKDDLAELERLVPMLNIPNPNPADMAALRRVLARPELARHLGDITHHTMQAFFESATGSSPAGVEVMRYQFRQIRDELGYKEAPPLDRLLIETVVLCWMRYQDTERRYSTLIRENLTIAQSEWWEHRVTACQRRYLRAVETLARVRRLSVGLVQINVGQQQVNQVLARPGSTGL